jgi:lipooligosaccharide transport system ATP-binding protein
LAEIEARGLTKRFGDRLAVDSVSFDVERGETYGLLGPNGAGKTSIMRMLAGLAPISSGTLRVAGLDVARQSRAVRARLGVVTQSDGLDGDLDVRQNLEIFGYLCGLSRAEARRRADEVLEFFDLTPRARDEVAELSGGMRRRLAIARALVARPPIIVLDEPTTGLDPESRIRLWEELALLKRAEVTLLMSTHYMDEAEILCDRLAILHSGRILDEGTPPELIGRHAGAGAADIRLDGATREDVRATLIAAGLPFREVGALFRVTGRDGVAPELPPLGGVQVARRHATLEDVFLALAGRGLSDV